MRQSAICMRIYCYFGFRKYHEGSFGMPACKPETDTE